MATIVNTKAATKWHTLAPSYDPRRLSRLAWSMMPSAHDSASRTAASRRSRESRARSCSACSSCARCSSCSACHSRSRALQLALARARRPFCAACFPQRVPDMRAACLSQRAPPHAHGVPLQRVCRSMRTACLYSMCYSMRAARLSQRTPQHAHSLPAALTRAARLALSHTCAAPKPPCRGRHACVP